jgi:hypothetical protein
MDGIGNGPCCPHINTDNTWAVDQSHERCLNCGDIREEGAWINIPGRVIGLLIVGNTRAARAFFEYMNKAREYQNIPYPDLTWNQYLDAASRNMKSKKPS